MIYYGFSDEKDNFINKMELFDCGNDNYKNYPEILNKLKENKVHKPDYIIVIYADVYSFIDPLIFLTADEKLFSKITEKCSNFLNIQDFELIKPLN